MNAITKKQPWIRLAACGALSLPLGAIALHATQASAQVSAIDQPYVVVVDQNAAPLRCGADELYYEVAKLDQGTMLLVDGSDTFGINGDGWLRVSFPAEQPALIKALPEQLDVDTMRGTLTLLRPSRLIAMSVDGDLSQSWKKLLAKPMEPGSTLKIIETIRDENGEPLAYIVPSPQEARGFIHGRFVRQATSEESVAFRAGQRESATALSKAPEPKSNEQIAMNNSLNNASMNNAPANTTPQPEAAQPQQEIARAEQTAAPQRDPDAALPEFAEPSSATIAQNNENTGASDDIGALLRGEHRNTQADEQAIDRTHAAPPMRRPTSTTDDTSSAVAGAGSDEDFGASRPRPKPQATEPVTQDTTPAIENRPLPTMRDLETAYAAVLAQKAGMAELEPLITEHERYVTAMDKGEAPGDELDREVIVAHLELLRIRADLQRSMLRIEGVREQAKQSIASIDEGIAGIDRSSEYVVVGRLTTSVVYDGKRLPLLYRVQSIDEDSGRTLAYVVPVNGVDCAASLGSIVGVAGSSRVDASSRLNIVTPQRIDRLQAGATAAVDEGGRTN